MKNVAIAVGCWLLTAVLVLPGCTPANNKGTATTAGAVAPAAGAAVGGTKIAHVNIDTLESQYEYLKTKREEFRKRQSQMEVELQSSYQKMQSDAGEIQKKAEARTLTQTEYESAQKRLLQMEKSLETRKQALTEQLVKEQEEFNKDLKSRLDAYITEYNKNHNYDYILSYSGAGSSILYANKSLDITKEIVDGMNQKAKNEKK
jgi:outer membrane protein